MRSHAWTPTSPRWRASCGGSALPGPALTVIKTSIGTAQSVAVAIDRAEWPEVVGTISGDDTIFIATASAAGQSRLVARLRENFKA